VSKRHAHRYGATFGPVAQHTVACTRDRCAFQRRWKGKHEEMSLDGGTTWGPMSHYTPECPVTADVPLPVTPTVEGEAVQ
jgi:hypothetical protein